MRTTSSTCKRKGCFRTPEDTTPLAHDARTCCFCHWFRVVKIAVADPPSQEECLCADLIVKLDKALVLATSEGKPSGLSTSWHGLPSAMFVCMHTQPLYTTRSSRWIYETLSLSLYLSLQLEKGSVNSQAIATMQQTCNKAETHPKKKPRKMPNTMIASLAETSAPDKHTTRQSATTGVRLMINETLSWQLHGGKLQEVIRYYFRMMIPTACLERDLDWPVQSVQINLESGEILRMVWESLSDMLTQKLWACNQEEVAFSIWAGCGMKTATGEWHWKTVEKLRPATWHQEFKSEKDERSFRCKINTSFMPSVVGEDGHIKK